MIRARKRFGQNFLTDNHIISKILNSLDLQATDQWLEIGPGLGAMTQHLLTEVQHVDAVEIDRDLVANLQQKLQNPKLTLHCQDILQFNPQNLPQQDYRILGNLPYNISTPILFQIMNWPKRPLDCFFMLQKEVAERMAAAPGSKKYGRLTIMIQYYAKISQLFDVPAQCFSPMPQVESCFIKLTPYSQPPYFCADKKLLNQIVTQSFQQRRKTIKNSLSKLIPTEFLEKAGIDLQARAETLSIEDYVKICNLATKML